MPEITREQVEKAVREVLGRMKRPEPAPKGMTREGPGPEGPRVLIVFNAGVRRLETALEQVRLIESAAGKSGVFTGDSARAWVCREDVKDKAGARCILDTVTPEGLEKVLERADVLVLPTLCIRVAARVASLTCGDRESDILLSALLQGKKVLASRDGFVLWDAPLSPKIRGEIEAVLTKLEGFGVFFCPTEALKTEFDRLTRAEGTAEKAAPRPEKGGGHRLITARDIRRAADDGQDALTLAPGGIVTPLALDLAREYSIQILRTANSGGRKGSHTPSDRA